MSKTATATATATHKVDLYHPLHDSNQSLAFQWATATVASKNGEDAAQASMASIAANLFSVAYVPAKGEKDAPEGRMTVMAIARQIFDANPTLPCPPGRASKGARDGFATAFASALASALQRRGAYDCFSPNGKQRAKAEENFVDKCHRALLEDSKGDKVATAEVRLMRARTLANREDAKPTSKAKACLEDAVSILEGMEGTEEVLSLLGRMASHLGWQED